MNYTLRPIRRLDAIDTVGYDDLILAEVKDDIGEPLTVKMKAGKAFYTTTIGLASEGIQIDLNDPLLGSISNLPDKLNTQTDMNQLLTSVIKDVLTTLDANPVIILSDSVPTKPNLNGSKQYHNEGTIWVDSTNFRSYVMFYDRDNPADPPNYLWVGLTDR